MAATVNYVLITFEGNRNTGDTQGINIYLEATKYIEKEYKILIFQLKTPKML